MLVQTVTPSIVFSRVPRETKDRDDLMRAFFKAFNVTLELAEICREPVFVIYGKSITDMLRLRMRGYIDGWSDARGV